jgi:hypothetical protein
MIFNSVLLTKESLNYDRLDRLQGCTSVWSAFLLCKNMAVFGGIPQRLPGTAEQKMPNKHICEAVGEATLQGAPDVYFFRPGCTLAPLRYPVSVQFFFFNFTSCEYHFKRSNRR